MMNQWKVKGALKDFKDAGKTFQDIYDSCKAEAAIFVKYIEKNQELPSKIWALNEDLTQISEDVQ